MSLYFKTLVFILSTLTAAQGVSVSQNEITNLVEMQIDTSRITLSGFSAGSTMATQMHISHSSIFHGVALFSQAYYRCGAASLIDFGLLCTDLVPGTIRHNIHLSIFDAYRYERQKRIDSLENLKSQKVFVWTGRNDDLIPFDVAQQNYDFYATFMENHTDQITPRDSIVHPYAKHVFPSDSFGLNCSEEAQDNYYIGNCGYSGAFESLHFLLGDAIQKPIGIALSELQVFDQTEFFDGANINLIGMATEGFIYVPEACSDRECLLHFHFHGCAEGADADGSLDRARNYIMNNGLLEVGELNQIIMVYPLTSDRGAFNNNGCWDFFQYTGRNFRVISTGSTLFTDCYFHLSTYSPPATFTQSVKRALPADTIHLHGTTKEGRQIKVIRNMIDRLAPSLVTDPPIPTTEDYGRAPGGCSTVQVLGFLSHAFFIILTQKLNL